MHLWHSPEAVRVAAPRSVRLKVAWETIAGHSDPEGERQMLKTGPTHAMKKTARAADARRE